MIPNSQPSRRQFLAAVGAAAAAPACGMHAPRPLPDAREHFLHFSGTGKTHRLRIYSPSRGEYIDEFSIDVERKQIAEYVELISNAPADIGDEGYKAVSLKLYDKVWAPLKSLLLTYRRLGIYAEEDFSDLPFEALLGNRGWIGRAAIVYYLRKPPHRGQSLLLPHLDRRPVYAYAPFPEMHGTMQWSRREARIVSRLPNATLREGLDACRDQLLRDAASGFSVLHIATHGMKAPDGSRTAYLALRAPRTANQEVDAIDRFPVEDLNARIRGRLLVISACAVESACGNPCFDFFGHRVREVISGRFAVNDRAAYTFMSEFYRQLESGITDTGVALLRARSKVSEGAYPAYHHPYYWAAFRSSI